MRHLLAIKGRLLRVRERWHGEAAQVAGAHEAMTKATLFCR